MRLFVGYFCRPSNPYMRKSKAPTLFLIACIALIGAFQPACAQDGVKREREVKVGMEAVPENAMLWLKDALDLPKRLNWYKQMSDDVRVYEVKYNWKGDFYSVEFDVDGEIVNIEILRKWGQLPDAGREGMEAYFDSTYSRHKLQKVQVQYTGESEQLKSVFSDAINEGLQLNYEVVYRGRDQSEHALWESLFDRDGVHLERSRIVLRAVDNISY